jgi:hypothetical protein
MPELVAALYIDPRGPYPYAEDPRAGLFVHCWDANRDARLYAGPWPVVAHPPCGPWGRLRHLYRGNEHDCAPRAVEQVRAYGGVLEHPAGSLLWCEEFPCAPGASRETQRLPQPMREWGGNGTLLSVDSFGGYTVEVDQCEWGHVARKRTWLYLVGVPHSALEAPPFPGREPTHYASGGRTKSSRTGGAVPAGKKVCSETQRSRTPPLFAEYLIRLAQAAAKERAA